jgi:hypothetical protein
MLEFYSHQFDTVELNNSFYRLPTEAAFDGWRQATPPNFVFAVKASRFLTHQKKLKDPERALEKLLPRASRPSNKLGPLPPRWRVNPPAEGLPLPGRAHYRGDLRFSQLRIGYSCGTWAFSRFSQPV